MTIDEAIKNVREKERQHRENAEYQINRNINSPHISLHIKVETRKSEEARQIAEWLEELKALNQTTQMVDKSNFSQDQYKADTDTAYQCGYTKAIEDFTEALYRKIADSNLNQYKDSVVEMIDDVAEQLKEGGIDG